MLHRSRCAGLLFRRIQLGSPAPRTALEHVSVVQQAVEHGAAVGRIAQQFAPVFYGRFEVNMVLVRS